MTKYSHHGFLVFFFTLLVVALWTVTAAQAQLKPGDTLGKDNCQQAKGLLPDRILQGFCSGEYGPTKIVEVPNSAYVYSERFRNATEANAGKYYVTEEGALHEQASKTWPRDWHGFPFPRIDPNDPQAAFKIMYNHQVAYFQFDDGYWFASTDWITPSGFDRSVSLGAYGTVFIQRPSGPIENPDETYLKDIIFGVAPYDVVGLSTMTHWTLDPRKWHSVWAYVPTIRRVRRLTAANTSEGVLGGLFARDDYYVWAGKVPYMNWKLIGEQDILAPITPGGIDMPIVPADAVPKKFRGDVELISSETVGLPAGKAGRSALKPEDMIKMRYQNGNAEGAAWWPVNVEFAVRRCWVVEATPKDPYYAYGRRIGYIDKSAYWAYWGELYDPSGEYWRTILWTDKMAYTPGRRLVFRYPFWGLMMDHKKNAAGVIDTTGKGYFTEFELGLSTSVYTTQNLSSLGK